MSIPVERRYATGRTRVESIGREPVPRFGKIAQVSAIATAVLATVDGGTILMRQTAKPRDYAVNSKVEVKAAKVHAVSTLATLATTSTTKLTAPKPVSTRHLARPATVTDAKTPRPVPVIGPPTTKVKLTPLVHSAGINYPSTYYALDVSWPKQNCSATPKVLAQAGRVIVGIDHGLPSNFNNDASDETDPKTLKPITCFEKEIKYAKSLELYANSAAPLRQNEFDLARQAPNSTPCAQNLDQCGYAFGYEVGFNEANFAIQSNLSNWDYRVWLDVENCGTYQCWNTVDLTENVQAIKGQIAGLEAGFQKLGHITVGFYSTSEQWAEITGNNYPDPIKNNSRPIWIASGSGNYSAAGTSWQSRVFDHGVPVYSQYVGSAPVPDGAGSQLDYDLPLS